MDLLKIKTKKTYVNKKGETKPVIVFALQLNDNCRILVKPVNDEDYKYMNVFSTFIDYSK